MYYIVLKVKIGRGAEGAVKISRKTLFGQICVSVMLPFCHFEVSMMLPSSKIFGHPLNRDLWSWYPSWIIQDKIWKLLFEKIGAILAPNEA